MARDGRPASGALVALILAIAAPGHAATGAGGDSSATLAGGPTRVGPTAPSPVAAAGPTMAGGFQLHRVPNPRWRPPSAALVPAAARAPRAIGEVVPRARVSRRDGPAASSDWQAAIGRHLSDGASDELSAAGNSERGSSRWSEAAARFRRRGWSAEVGDLRAETVPGGPVLERLRGAAYARALGEARWRVAVGAVPDLPRRSAPNLAVVTAGAAGLPLLDARAGFAALGFHRGVADADPFGATDSTSGACAMLLATARAQGPAGVLAQTLGFQVHTLDGRARPALQNQLDWTVERGPWVAALRSAMAGPGSRQVFADRLLPAPSQMHGVSGRLRPRGSRFEAHAAGFLRSDFYPGGRIRSLQVGAGWTPRTAGWRLDAGGSWLRGTAPTREERMATLQAARTWATGLTVALRADRTVAQPGDPVTQLGAELSGPTALGLRASLEPRMRLVRGAVQRAVATTRIGGLLPQRSWGFWVSGTVAAERDRLWRGELAQVELSLLWTPWRRSRASLDVRHYREPGNRSIEYVASVDGAIPLREGTAAASPSRTGRIEVRVVGGDDGRPVRDALVSVDGRRYGFTDAGGVASIDGLEPGSHTVTLESRSLPPGHEVVGPPATVVVVDRQGGTAVVRFEVMRPARKVRF